MVQEICVKAQNFTRLIETTKAETLKGMALILGNQYTCLVNPKPQKQSSVKDFNIENTLSSDLTEIANGFKVFLLTM